ncbi:Tat pathway signal sequence domain protein [Ectothiorhodospiraceae bacterium WFHF3C12]|nr:Tat pathway signal sequence domain protein [Ectothiorhodospiraceae bacterium WFHF3C12]
MAADPGTIDVELNKLEDRDNGDCRAYMVFQNATESRLEVFQLDLVLFDADGIITRRLALEAGPLNAGKTVVKLFDMTSTACAEIGQILVNGVVECRTSKGPVSGCTRRTRVTTRADVPFLK